MASMAPVCTGHVHGGGVASHRAMMVRAITAAHGLPANVLRGSAVLRVVCGGVSGVEEIARDIAGPLPPLNVQLGPPGDFVTNASIMVTTNNLVLLLTLC